MNRLGETEHAIDQRLDLQVEVARVGEAIAQQKKRGPQPQKRPTSCSKTSPGPHIRSDGQSGVELELELV